MATYLSSDKVIQERVFSSLQDSAYVEHFLARKFGAAYGISTKSPKPPHIQVYAGASPSLSPSHIKTKGDDLRSPSNRLKESLT